VAFACVGCRFNRLAQSRAEQKFGRCWQNAHVDSIRAVGNKRSRICRLVSVNGRILWLAEVCSTQDFFRSDSRQTPSAMERTSADLSAFEKLAEGLQLGNIELLGQDARLGCLHSVSSRVQNLARQRYSDLVHHTKTLEFNRRKPSEFQAQLVFHRSLGRLVSKKRDMSSFAL